MKRTLTILFLSVFCFLKGLPQETKIIGIIDGAHQSNDALRVVTFDYVSSIYDTLLSVDDNFWVKDFATVIDLQRGIIYFLKESGACGYEPKIIYALDILTHEIKPIVNLDGLAFSEVLALFYDMFNNRLIYRDRANIRSYDLTTGEHKLICNLDNSLSEIYGNVTVYNPITNKLLYFAGQDIQNHFEIYSIYVDVSKGTIEKTLKINNNHSSIGDISCDILSDKYYGTISATDSIVEFDPLTGQTQNIALVCLGNWSNLNGQVPVFDYYNHTYIIPLCKSQNANISSSLDLVKITDNSSTCISFQKGMDTDDHHLFSGKDIFLKLEDNKLVASYCDTYTWYLNGAELLNADSQYFSPPQSGFYKFSTYVGGEIHYSNEILYQPNGLNSLNTDKEIKIYPNPISDELNIEFPETLTGLKTLIMFDLYGNSIFSTKTKTFKSQYKIKTNPGIYYLKIFLEDNNVITKKVIVI